MPGDPKGYTRTRAMVTCTLITGSGRELEIGPWDGDLQISGMEQGFKATIPLTDRGTYKGSVTGDDVYPTLALTVRHAGKLQSAASTTLRDMIDKKGEPLADGDVTTDPEGVWHLKARIVISAPDGVDTLTVCNARWKYDYSTGEKNTLALSATCYRDATGTDPIVFS